MTLDAAAPYLPFLIALVACLYSSVGHGGASGYVALLSLTTLSSGSVKVTGLTLNLVVATIAFLAFRQARHFSWSLTWPFLLGAAPFAYLGAKLELSERAYFTLVGIVVTWAGIRLLLSRVDKEGEEFEASPKPVVGLGIGTGVGLLSGMVGVGGGIFLSPILVLSKWADAKRSSAASAIFIVSNSAVGLFARAGSGLDVPPNMIWLIIGGGAGALVGSWVGAKHLPVSWLRRVLGIVLLVAAVKLLTK